MGTTGGIDGDVGDLEDGDMTGGQFGQGTTAGIGIIYHVTVNRVAAGNRYFIDDKPRACDFLAFHHLELSSKLDSSILNKFPRTNPEIPLPIIAI